MPGLCKHWRYLTSLLPSLSSLQSTMGNGMNKIVPGLYVGNFRDAKDVEQLAQNNITHILSIHDNAKKILEDKEYLCIIASDSPTQDLTKHFTQCIDFIHKARLGGGAVVVHCLAGVSRSVTITAAYLMAVTNLGWREAIKTIRGARQCANPNYGFQRQLVTFESVDLEQERQRLKAKFPENPFSDEEDCRKLMQTMNIWSSRDDDGLDPLPHRAYQKRDVTTTSTTSEQEIEKTEQKEEKNDAER